MVKSSPKTTNASAAPNNDDVEKMTPVRIEPNLRKAKRNSRIENAILKAPTDNKYGIAAKGMLKLNPRTIDIISRAEPPTKHFKAVTANRSLFLLRNLLRLLSNPQNKHAEMIRTLPARFPKKLIP